MAESTDLDTQRRVIETRLDSCADAIERLEEQMEALQSKVVELEQRAPEPGKQEYDALDRHEKATIARTKLRELAENGGGHAAMNYKDVIQLFDGHPSPGHAYDIMEAAGGREGFEYGKAPNGEKRLTYTVKGQR